MVTLSEIMESVIEDIRRKAEQQEKEQQETNKKTADFSVFDHEEINR